MITEIMIGVHHEGGEGNALEHAAVVVQGEVADRQERLDRGQVGEDLEIGLEAGHDQEEQRQPEHQGQQDPADVAPSDRATGRLFSAGFVDDTAWSVRR